MLKQPVSTSDDSSAQQQGSWNLAFAGKIITIAAQLVVLVLTIRTFNLLDQAFLDVFHLILFGFLINAVLPLRYRLPFFTLLSLASIYTILGLVTGTGLIALGLILISICHLPVSFRVRVGALIMTGLLLAAMRSDWNQFPGIKQQLAPFFSLLEFSEQWSPVIWPILGSMFMFRLITYLHDIHYEKGRHDIWRSLGYFFMIPNVCFPLFPVVDYARFSQDYYNEEAVRIYQRGISWIFRGVTHLIVYQFIYLYMTLDPVEIGGLADMLQYSLSAFLLYLQVSGQFHLVVGILLLFGFNLPETNHLYYLASSFNNHWRRINIYWKDFMMKVLYYPLYFRLRKLGNTNAIVLSTIVVFFATWSLHAYQWFWLRGTVLLEWHDGLFWAILGTFVIANSLYEIKHGRGRSLGKHKRNVYDLTATAMSTAGTFLTMCILWGMWSSDSLSQWMSLWETTGNGWIGVFTLVPVLFLASYLFGRLSKRQQKVLLTPAPEKGPVSFWRLAIPSILGILVVYSLGQSTVYSLLPSTAANAFQEIRFKLNEGDLARRERGYYEDLVGVNRQNRDLWNVYNQRPENWNYSPGAVIRTGDFLEVRYVPNHEAMFRGEVVTTNRWGMRDKDYEQTPPPGTQRIALLGASHVFGSGVKDEETFETIIENRLNSEYSGDSGIIYEILNFGRQGRTALHQVMILEQEILAFKPDTIIYVTHPKDPNRLAQSLARQVYHDHAIPYPYVDSILEQAGINKDMKRFSIERALMPYKYDLLEWAYGRITSICRENGVTPVWVLLPMTYERLKDSDIERHVAAAEAAGFTIISLKDVYNSAAPDELVIAAWDDHPNVLGHQLIAEHLYDAIRHREIITPPR
jgi:D-alanyl-lipoteichoic acid acyltransferase DltB (MBOAT superfamily)